MRLALVVGMIAMSTAAAAEKRPMTIDDLFAFKRVSDPQISPDGKWVVYAMQEITDASQNKKHTHLWMAASDGLTPPRQLTSSGKSDSHPRWSPDGTKILFESTRGGTPQLYILDLKAGGEATPVTNISTGAGTGVWSPDGSHIAFVSAVYPEFSTLPFAESDKKNKEKNDAFESNIVKAKTFTKLFYRHWDEYVGDKRQHIFVCKSDGSECRDVTPGDRDAHPTSSTFSSGDDLTFTPDGRHIVFTAVPAKNEAWSTNYELCRVRIDNQSTAWETLTKDNPAADSGPKFSPDGKKLAWRAQKRAGYEADKWDIHVVDCKPDGSFAGNIQSNGPRSDPADKTILDPSVNEFAWILTPNGSYGFLYTADCNGRVPLFLLPLGDGESSVISPDVQAHCGSIASVSVGPDAQVVFTWTSLRSPAEIFVKPNGKNPRINISRANTSLLDQLHYATPESVSVKVEDGEMQMWILKPPGFDAGKKWPLVYLVHGGPQGAWDDGWSYRWNPQLWAAQGYVVALPNPRGSTGFGQKFVDEITGDWGGKCYRDLVAGLEYLKKEPYIDAARIGSAGASFGGYMMNWFAVNDIAKDFQCLITHCSVWNFESMWGTTDELWFDEWEHGGLPWEKPGKYREFSPHIRAGELAKHKVPMLIIHNDNDFRCPIGQGHELFSALQRLGVKSRFVNFPDESHWVLKPANSRHWHKEVFAWLKELVPPGPK